jgi:hypothetical protein
VYQQQQQPLQGRSRDRTPTVSVSTTIAARCIVPEASPPRRLAHISSLLPLPQCWSPLQALNQYLAKLPEHNDLPRISYAGIG